MYGLKALSVQRPSITERQFSFQFGLCPQNPKTAEIRAGFLSNRKLGGPIFRIVSTGGSFPDSLKIEPVCRNFRLFPRDWFLAASCC
jgi:hypothetical protein